MSDDTLAVDNYIYKDVWEANTLGIQESTRQNAIDLNPGYVIDTETETCPVPGVDDENVMLVHITLKPE